jgi:hypothetical protein
MPFSCNFTPAVDVSAGGQRPASAADCALSFDCNNNIAAKPHWLDPRDDCRGDDSSHVHFTDFVDESTADELAALRF